MMEMFGRKITRILFLFNIFRFATVSDLHFPVNFVTKKMCIDVKIGTIVDKHRAISNGYPLKYTLGDGNPYFNIDKGNGNIFVTGSLADANASYLMLSKHVTDGHGSRADLLINITLVRPVITSKACPKIHELRVREIAPAGEEVGMVECISNINDTNVIDARTLLSVTSHGVSSANVPFNVTSNGMVVVSRPLVYMNSIQDIQIVNVTFMYLKNRGDPSTNCNRIETKIAVKIIVEKTECNSTWKYDVKKNLQLTVVPVATIQNSTPENCMSVCSNNESLLCHAFNYNAVRMECLLLNETEFTQTNMTKRRMGMILYRKYCDSATLPLLYLRQAIARIKNVTNIAINSSQEILGNLLTVGVGLTNSSLHDVMLTTSIFLKVVDKTVLDNTTSPQLKLFLKICGELFDLLLSRTENFSLKRKVRNQLLTVFNTLIEALSRVDHTISNTITVKSIKTAFSIRKMYPMGILKSPIKSRTSRNDIQLIFPPQNYSGGCNRTTLVTGTIGGLEDIITPVLVENNINSSRLKLGGHVVSIVMEPEFSDQFEVLLDISTNEKNKNVHNRVCGFIETGTKRQSTSRWYTDGCKLVTYNSSHTRCRCLHLTNFAILMQVKMFQIEKVHVVSLEILTKIGCCTSIAALSTTVIVLLWLRLRSERYYVLLHLSVAVIMAQVVFLLGIDAVHYKLICRLVAILLHYLYLSVFTLMLAEGIHLFHKLHRAFDADDNLNMLLFLGWGSPFVIISLSLISAGDGYSTEQHCWLSTEGTIWAFVGPALTIITINIAILVMIIRTFLGVAIVAKKTDLQKFKASLKATVVLLPLLGITWMFGVVAVNESTVIFQYIFAILNSLQGLFIFLFHVVLNEDVKKACSIRRRNQVSSVDLCQQSLTIRKRHKKANLYSASTYM